MEKDSKKAKNVGRLSKYARPIIDDCPNTPDINPVIDQARTGYTYKPMQR